MIKFVAVELSQKKGLTANVIVRCLSGYPEQDRTKLYIYIYEFFCLKTHFDRQVQQKLHITQVSHSSLKSLCISLSETLL